MYVCVYGVVWKEALGSQIKSWGVAVTYLKSVHHEFITTNVERPVCKYGFWLLYRKLLKPFPIYEWKEDCLLCFWYRVCFRLMVQFSSVQLLSRVRLFATPWIAALQASLSHHQLLEFTQTHVHRAGDAIQPSHPLLPPSPPAPNPSQHHSLFQWVNSSHEVAKVLEFQL